MRTMVLVLASLLATPVFAQSFSPEEAVRLAIKEMNNPAIAKDMPELYSSNELRVYTPDFNYTKPLKRHIFEIIPENGASRFYLYKIADRSLTRINDKINKTSHLTILYDSENWHFFAAIAFNKVTLD